MAGSVALTLIYFYPRPPWGGRPEIAALSFYYLYISIHALRGEGDSGFIRARQFFKISIHALRGEGDVVRVKADPLEVFISIHALRGEGDFYADFAQQGDEKFLSTPSVGRATVRGVQAGLRGQHFYPRPPWGGRPLTAVYPSLHSSYFYPRPPWGGRPGEQKGEIVTMDISIHALRGEGDNPADRHNL